MALAYLFSKLLKMEDHPKIGDNPVDFAQALVIDHALREGSHEEAVRVRTEVKKLGIQAHIRRLKWRQEIRQGLNPSSLPNVESLARAKRYRALSSAAIQFHVSSVFFAHHRDDQYETVLMRLLAGHTYRGLQGMRVANDIPECYDKYGAYKSGLLDDQKTSSPGLSFKPPRTQLRRLRNLMRDERIVDPWDKLRHYLGADSTSAPFLGHFPGHIDRSIDSRIPYLTPLGTEDGGLKVYRPLLEFDKARLVATCEVNKVPWFEDHTNRDPTLTTRNAVRYLAKEHELPSALQKPSVLALSQRSRRRADLEETAAHRLLTRKAVIQAFDPNAGTLLVELPAFGTQGHERNQYTRTRQELRKPHRRVIATIAIRKLIEFVTPETYLPPLANLERTVDRLFPGLALEPSVDPPKAFSIAGVMFEPIGSMEQQRWFLSRAPLSSTKLPPLLRLSSPEDGSLSPSEAQGELPKHRRLHWHGWRTNKLWDGRFWIRLRKCVTARFHVEPLHPGSLKAFRMALPPRQGSKLARIMKHYAPGKVRYTLPALYSAERTAGRFEGTMAPGDVSRIVAGPAAGTHLRLTLLALPSLGFALPGLERWVKCDVSYRKIDSTLLGLSRRGSNARMLGYYPSCSASRRRRGKNLGRRTRRRMGKL